MKLLQIAMFLIIERSLTMANLKSVIKVSIVRQESSPLCKITIPKAITEAMQLKNGEQLIVELEGEEIKIRRF